ncbi:MAG: ABC transporter permease [Chloroflexales bacterium]|nr:ABC transporter permease [Chloroflexales bacterium]
MALFTPQAATAAEPRNQPAVGRMSALGEVALMTQRSLMIVARTPEAIVPSILISLFLLLIFNAALSGTAALVPEFQGVDYIAFLLPFTLITAVLDSPGGQAMVRDIESGYFDKLLLTPIRRAALVLGHILASGLVIMFVAALLLLAGLLMGLRPATGVAGLIATLLFALLIGAGFAGFTIGVALRTGNAGATQGASFAFFPLSFLSTAFFPLEYLQGWLKIAAQLNPITYILEALRSLLIVGWDTERLAVGLLASALVSIAPFAFALASLHARTRRR